MLASLPHIPKALRHLRNNDPDLRPILRLVGPFAMQMERNRFAALAWSIISQQISIHAARTIRNRLAELVAPRRLNAATIQAIALPDLQKVGLSRAKASYLHDLADKVASRAVSLRSIHRYDDEEVIQRLVPVKGIGRWTAEMFLIFCLGRPDVLPVDDLGLRVAMQRLCGLTELPDKETIRRRAAVWQPYRSVATWYLWQSLKNKPSVATGQ